MSNDYYSVLHTIEKRFDKTTGRLTERLCRNQGGQLDNDGDEPARILYGKTSGQPILQEWYRNGERHREGNPALILEHPGQRTTLLEWWQNDEQFRSDGSEPTSILQDSDTSAWIVVKHIIGHVKHRIDGPAVIGFDRKTGKETAREYWVEGERVSAKHIREIQRIFNAPMP